MSLAEFYQGYEWEAAIENVDGDDSEDEEVEKEGDDDSPDQEGDVERVDDADGDIRRSLRPHRVAMETEVTRVITMEMIVTTILIMTIMIHMPSRMAMMTPIQTELTISPTIGGISWLFRFH